QCSAKGRLTKPAERRGNRQGQLGLTRCCCLTPRCPGVGDTEVPTWVLATWRHPVGCWRHGGAQVGAGDMEVPRCWRHGSAQVGAVDTVGAQMGVGDMEAPRRRPWVLATWRRPVGCWRHGGAQVGAGDMAVPRWVLVTWRCPGGCWRHGGAQVLATWQCPGGCC
ncbi:unnamed protein product, partial [Staurois parvus]